jgi:transcriptional regulator with XRE-family HTH domain
MARRRDDELLQRLGARVRALRTSRRLTQQQFAEQVGLEPETVSRCERGRQPLSVANLARIGELFGVSVGSLVDADEPLPPPALSDSELEVLNLFRSLPPAHQEMTVKLLRTAARS